jgi:hypothetical protein
MPQFLMNIAAFNGFPFHDEIFGYIIHYCKTNNHKLTIFCRTETQTDYLIFYKKHFKDYCFTIIDCRMFTYFKYNYDSIFLLTDDDGNYNLDDSYINSITIRIDHDYRIRNNDIQKYIAIRPFKTNNRTWALPCFPIVLKQQKQDFLRNNNQINICILGGNYGQYDTKIINRLTQLNSNNKICIHAMARTVNKDNFIGLDESRFKLYTYENLQTCAMVSILKVSNYILTDVSKQDKYKTDMMAGAIPFSFSTLTALILSKESNSHYEFKNVVEFSENDNEPIFLQPIEIQMLEDERTNLISNFEKEANKLMGI